jgi:hypothetical protein
MEQIEYRENFNTNQGIFNIKNIIIIVLVIILFLTFLGINIFHIIGNFTQNVVIIIGPLLNGIYVFVINILSILGFSTGSLINAVSDTTDNVLNTVGNELIDISKRGLDLNLNTSKYSINNPQPDSSNSIIQKNITSNKNKYCLVGTDPNSGKNSCFELTENQQCLSNNIFNDKETCLYNGTPSQSGSNNNNSVSTTIGSTNDTSNSNLLNFPNLSNNSFINSYYNPFL